MSEKRKPCFTILLKKPGKKNVKIELFESSEFPDGWYSAPKRYRLRINGKWNDKAKEGNVKYFTKWTFRDILFRSIKL